MKQLILTLSAAAAIAVAMTACDSKAKLAEEVAGTWTTEQQTIANDAQGMTTGNDVVSFLVTDKDKRGGEVNIASTLSLTRAASALTPANEPFQTTVAATASISGTWKAVDDDDIVITFDANSLAVNVDPDAVAMTANPMSGMTQSTIDSLRPQMAQFYQTELTNTMRQYYNGYSRLDDVKLKDNGTILKVEIKDTDILLHRQ